MASPITQGWIYATVPIDNPQGESGTGFFVSRVTDAPDGRVFLVTNKHVVNRDTSKLSSVPHIVCHFNTKDSTGAPGVKSGEIPLVNPVGTKRYREHPDPDTDVVAFDVTDVIALNPDLERRWVEESLVADANMRAALDITVGEDILIIGYPLGLRQGESNFPLVRQGLIATKIGTLLKDQVQTASGGVRSRSLRAFLFDGASVPGSSGSPILLKPVIGRLRNGMIELQPAPTVLLGIVAETRYAPVALGSGFIPGFAGLGLAFEAETIRETIDLFF